ncbi:MAG: hypothetical protein QOI51_1180, partial [Nocardioidaceae bacterium]|nr:hypothetical protein [Nocardioidaceae bacterium]
MTVRARPGSCRSGTSDVPAGTGG